MFLSVYVLIGGPMNLSFICLERYIAVIHPTFYPLLKKYRCREVCALSVWLLVVPLSLMKVLSEERDIYMVSDTVAYTVSALLVIIMVWSNVTILKALRTLGLRLINYILPKSELFKLFAPFQSSCCCVTFQWVYWVITDLLRDTIPLVYLFLLPYSWYLLLVWCIRCFT